MYVPFLDECEERESRAAVVEISRHVAFCLTYLSVPITSRRGLLRT